LLESAKPTLSHLSFRRGKFFSVLPTLFSAADRRFTEWRKPRELLTTKAKFMRLRIPAAVGQVGGDVVLLLRVDVVPLRPLYRACQGWRRIREKARTREKEVEMDLARGIPRAPDWCPRVGSKRAAGDRTTVPRHHFLPRSTGRRCPLARRRHSRRLVGRRWFFAKTPAC
jgi:hypothetical protein